MNCIFYNFAKRENSTAQPPVGNPGYTYDCKLKDEVSVITPHIILSKPSDRTYSELIGFNYVFISDFFRYYFVRDAIFINATQIEYVLECDVLGSFKTQIGNASEYVLRSASTYDPLILDDLYPMTADVSIHYGSVTAPGVTPASYEWNPFSGLSSMNIVGIINDSNTIKNGAVTYYKVSDTALANMMNYLLSSAGYFNLNPTEISDNLAKALVNPIQYVTEAYYLPYDWGSPYTAEHLKMGWWDLPTDGTCDGIPMAGAVAINTLSPIASENFYLPIHPQASSRGSYLRCAPWTRYMLHAGPFGNIPIDPASVADSEYIICTIYGNMFGDVLLKIKNKFGQELSYHRANIKHTFCVGQINNDPSQFMAGLVNTAGSFMNTASNAIGSIAGTASGIMSNQHNLYPQCQTAGANGSGADNGIGWKLVAEFHNCVDDDNTHRGRPLCKVKTLNSLSGYILVADPDLSITGTAEENTKIKGYLSSGFYYE